MKPGRYVVFEGVDGGGKTTQLERLAQRLEAQGVEVVRLREPTDGPIGQEIRRRAQHGPPMTPDEELTLFLDDRRANVSERVRPALERGAWVVQDRYFYSTAAYQGARPELGRAPESIVALHTEWAPEPDAVVVLDLPVEAGLARVSKRGARDAFEEEAFQERVRANFLALAATRPHLHVVSADASVDAVEAAVREALAPLTESACG